MNEYDGPERRKAQCFEHPNCVYRLELLEAWRTKIDRKLDSFQKLLVANLGGICTLLLTALAGTLFYIVKTH